MQHQNKAKPPIAPAPNFEEIPEELRNLKQWVMWRYVWKETSWTKVPMQPDGTAASTTDPETWASFDSVVLAFNQRVGYFSGIGFVFTRESGYVGIDLDNCIEWQTIDGVSCPVFGQPIKRTLARIPETYIEYSPSRTGAHFIVKANPKQAVKFTEGGFEIYAEGRYFTVTGDVIDSSPIADATEAVNEIVEILLGTRQQAAQPERSTKEVPLSYLNVEERLDIACNHASNSAEIKKLFDGDFSDYKRGDNEGRSEADMALCRYLAFYAENNPTLLIQMMNLSQMVRPKWEKRYSDGTTYLTRLVKQVLASERNFFEPAKSFLNQQPAKIGNERSSRKYKLLELGEAALKYRNDPAARGIECGGEFYELDQVYRPRRKLMTVVVGEPGSGKTTYILNYLYHLAMKHRLQVGFVSFENDPVDLTHSLVQAHIKKPTFPEFDKCCTEAEFMQALDEIGKQFTVYDPTWEEQNVAGLSGFWEDSIKAEGLDCIYLDPFTELQPPAQLLGKYTDFVSQQLSQFVNFTRSRSLMSWLVCHPTKNFTRKDGLKLWNINGSGDFERKADFGLVLTLIDGKLQVDVQKVRHWRTGHMGAQVAYFYSLTKGVFTATQPTLKEVRGRNNQPIAF